MLSITDEMDVHKNDSQDSRSSLIALDQATEFNTICRLCLSDATSAVVDIFSFYNDEEIASIVSQHFWFQIFKGDGQSDRLCTNCWVAVEGFHKFFKDVQQIHNSLPNYFGKSQRIKEEEEENITDIASDSELDEEILNIYDPYEVMDVKHYTPKDENCFEPVEENEMLPIERKDTDWHNENQSVHSENATVLESCQEALNGTLPDKSFNKYKNTYEAFINWQKSKKVTSFAEPVLLAYFSELSPKYKPSSTRCTYSMLRSTLISIHKVDISGYMQLRSFLKKMADGFPKEPKVFTAEQVNTFMMEAPDAKYLAMKTVLVFGLIGVYARDEVINVKTNYVKDNGSEIIIRIPDTKTKVVNAYTIEGKLAEIVRKYMKIRPTTASTDKFFLQYRNGKCTAQAIGKNNIFKIPKEIARFLKLPESEAYNGRSFRTTSKRLENSIAVKLLKDLYKTP